MLKSPCKNICEMNKDSGLCNGCKRNSFEIFNWINFADEEKKIILIKTKERSKINNKI
jgi:predicted Fe-S protein YdhL (DUF1289 family)